MMLTQLGFAVDLHQQDPDFTLKTWRPNNQRFDMG